MIDWTQNAGYLALGIGLIGFLGAIVGGSLALLSQMITVHAANRRDQQAADRDTRQWTRDSLLDTATTFLEMSFTRPAEEARQLHVAGAEEREVASLHEHSLHVHQLQNDAMTRMRLLAPSDVVLAAEQLHIADDTLYEAARTPGRLAGLTETDWNRLKEEQRTARKVLVDAVRDSFGLSEGVPIDDLLPRPLPDIARDR